MFSSSSPPRPQLPSLGRSLPVLPPPLPKSGPSEPPLPPQVSGAATPGKCTLARSAGLHAAFPVGGLVEAHAHRGPLPFPLSHTGGGWFLGRSTGGGVHICLGGTRSHTPAVLLAPAAFLPLASLARPLCCSPRFLLGGGEQEDFPPVLPSSRASPPPPRPPPAGSVQRPKSVSFSPADQLQVPEGEVLSPARFLAADSTTTFHRSAEDRGEGVAAPLPLPAPASPRGLSPCLKQA